MDRRLSLQALMSTTVCAVLPGAASAATRQITSSEHTLPDQQEAMPDALYAQAVAVVLINQQASIGLVQRHLKLGYSHAARLLNSMEQAGLIDSRYVDGYRQVLAHGKSLTTTQSLSKE